MQQTLVAGVDLAPQVGHVGLDDVDVTAPVGPAVELAARAVDAVTPPQAFPAIRLSIRTRDRPGLLFDLTRTLANANVYIASAVIATYGEQVVDTFYVKDMFGLKFHSLSKQKSLERKLREAIEKGVERAIS